MVYYVNGFVLRLFERSRFYFLELLHQMMYIEGEMLGKVTIL
jgi:hypothetical protein